jgi:ribosomal protein S12 methylthiotransferase accessory factor
MSAGMLAAAFDRLYDPRIGIIAGLDEAPPEPGSPDFIHVAARTCDTAVLGGAPGPFTVAAAAASRESAVIGALRAGLARYAAAFYERQGLPLSSYAEAGFPCIPPETLALFSQDQYRRAGFPYVPFDRDTPVRWARAIDLATGESIHVPAGLVWHPFRYVRSAGDRPVMPAHPAGLAAGDSVAEAALTGICEVVARDSAALFWHSLTAPPILDSATLPPPLRDLLGRFEIGGDRVTLLDVTTDNRVPSYVAALSSERPEAPSLVFGLAADLDPAAAVRGALLDLAAARREAVSAMFDRAAPSPTNDWEDVIEPADHLAFAADPGNRPLIASFLDSDDRRQLADRDNAATGSAGGDLEVLIGRVTGTGRRVLAANVTSEDLAELGLAVCRAVIPGYQPLAAGHALRALGGARLYETPQRLGYRGIMRGSAGNPAPHPFR